METPAQEQQSASVLQSSTGTIVHTPPTPSSEGTASETEQKLQQLTETPPSVEPSVPTQTQPEVSTEPSAEEVPAQQDLSWLNAPTTQAPTPETQTQVPSTPEFKKFSQDFENILGFPLEDLRAGMTELQQFRQQVAQTEARNAIKQQETSLQEEWGVTGDDFNMRINAVRQRFSSFSPEMQQRLDNVEGAKLIWAKLQQEESDSGIPVFQRSTGTGRTNAGKAKPQFTRSEIQRMSPDVYERYSSQILAAYKQGLVVDDLGGR